MQRLGDELRYILEIKRTSITRLKPRIGAVACQ